MKMCRFSKYICITMIITMVLSGMCFANDKADSLLSCTLFKSSLCNSEAEIYDVEMVSNLQMLRSANSASVIRENKQCIPKNETRISAILLLLLDVSKEEGANIAAETYEVFEDCAGSSMIVKFIQRQDGKKNRTLMI